MDTTWLTEPWILWIFLYMALVVEAYALWTQYAHKHWPEKYPKPAFQITISRMYWRAHKRFPMLDALVLSTFAWLLPHFVFGDFNGAAEWGWTLVLWVAIWIWHFKFRGVK